MMKKYKKLTLLTILTIIFLITFVYADNSTTQTQIEMAENLSDFDNATPIKETRIIKDWNTEVNFSATELEPGKTYHFRVRAKNGDDVITEWSDVISKTTIPATPTAPTLEATDIESIKIAWTSIEGADKYILLRDGTEIYRGTDLIFKDSGLNKNKEYSYTLKSGNTSGESGLSEQSSIYTFADKVSNINVENATKDSITLTWDANGNPDGTKYKAYRNADLIKDATIDMFILTDIATVPGVNYQYKVTAVNGNDVETDGTVIEYRINNNPSIVEIKNITNTSLDVEFNSNGNPVGTEYRIYLYKADSTLVETKEKTQNNDAITATFDSLIPNTEYYAKVDTKIFGTNYTDQTTKTNNRYTLANAPTNLSITDITLESIALAWENNYNPYGTVYELIRSDDATTPIYIGTELSYIDNTVAGGSTYTYKVRARNGENIETAYSNELTYRINTAPTLVELTDIGINNATVTWDKNGNPVGTEYKISLYKADNTQVGEEITYIQTDAENNVVFTGLIENEQYYAKVKTKVSDNVYTEYTQSLFKYTLANVPSIELINATQDTIDGTIKFEPSGGY